MAAFVDALESGDARSMLEALRLTLAKKIAAGVSPRDLAALSLQLRNVVRELDELAPPRA